jgi:hypothetical protein
MIIVTHKHIPGIYKALADAVVYHFRTTNAIQDPEHLEHRAMNQRTLDIYVVWAFISIFSRYFYSLIKIKNRTPYYIFNVKNVEVGRYSASSVLRNPAAALSPVAFFFLFHVTLLRSVFVYAAALRGRNEIDAIFLGDISYLDGIWLDYFLNREGVVVYLKQHPHGMLCVKRSHPSLLDFLKSEGVSSTPLTQEVQEKVETLMKRRLQDPASSIFYYNVENEPLRSPVETVSATTKVVVYAHAFTDAQLEGGFDGFRDMHQWLRFTVDELSKQSSKVQVYLKAHPNFFSGRSASQRESLDKYVWDHLVKDLPKSVVVIDYPVSNFELLSSLEPARDVLVSHHGNALVEGAFLGFRTISSAVSPWFTNYEFSNTWMGKANYSRLLASIVSLPPSTSLKMTSARKFAADFYLQEKGEFSESWYMPIISRHSTISQATLENDPYSLPLLKGISNQRLIEELSDSVKISN